MRPTLRLLRSALVPRNLGFSQVAASVVLSRPSNGETTASETLLVSGVGSGISTKLQRLQSFRLVAAEGGYGPVKVRQFGSGLTDLGEMVCKRSLLPGCFGCQQPQVSKCRRLVQVLKPATLWSEFGAETAYHRLTLVMSEGGSGYDLGWETSAWSTLTGQGFGLVGLAFGPGVDGSTKGSSGLGFEKAAELVSPYVKGKVKI